MQTAKPKHSLKQTIGLFPIVSPVFQALPVDHADRPFLRVADYDLRSGAAADRALHHGICALRRGNAADFHGDEAGLPVHRAAPDRRGCELLYAVDRTLHGLAHRGRHAPRPVFAFAGFAARLL